MTDTGQSSDAIRDALQFVAVCDIPAQHKRVVMEIVSQALRDAEARQLSEPARKTETHWQQHEIQTITAQLEGRVAVNWQHADESVMWLAACLHRTPDDIRKKATELGFGAGVDYRAARSLRSMNEINRAGLPTR